MKGAALACAMLLAACGSSEARPLQVASGTIIVDTGLGGPLAERYLRETDVRLAVRAVGSGEAFALARRGEVDLLWVHDPAGLRALKSDGRVARKARMFSIPWVVAGPPDDPAGAAAASVLSEAFARIASARAPFVSRGDRSGTHAHELELWEEAGGRPEGDWYAATGQGQAETLRVADEKEAYVLTDEATFAMLERTLHMKKWSTRDPGEVTVYEAVALKGKRSAEAGRFVEFASSSDTRRFMTRFGAGFRP